MIVETAFADCYRLAQQGAQLRKIARRIVSGCIVRMDARCRENVAGIRGGNVAGGLCGGQRFTDTDDGNRARVAGAGDYVVAVAGERRVREVGVAVDEDGRMPPA